MKIEICVYCRYTCICCRSSLSPTSKTHENHFIHFAAFCAPTLALVSYFCVYVCILGPFNWIEYHYDERQLCAKPKGLPFMCVCSINGFNLNKGIKPYRIDAIISMRPLHKMCMLNSQRNAFDEFDAAQNRRGNKFDFDQTHCNRISNGTRCSAGHHHKICFIGNGSQCYIIPFV